MKACPFCQKDIADDATACPHCNRDLVRMASRPAVPRPVTPLPAPVPSIARVSVIDIDMPFGQMIWFMIKLGIAAIPAMLILTFLGAIVAGVVTGVMTGLVTPRRAAADAPVGVTMRAPITQRLARQLRGFSYAQVVTTLGQPSSQEPGVLIYQAANGNTLRLIMDNDHVATAAPSDFDLTTIAKSR